MLSETELKNLIPTHLHSRITFYGDTNVQDIRFRDLRQMVHDAWDIPISMVDAVHASPRCTTMSRAPRGRGPQHFVGTTPVSAEAIRDLRALKQTLHLMRSLRTFAPSCMLSVENPAKGKFELLPCVLAMRQHGFELRYADHCMMANDSDSHIFTQKPTAYLLGNVKASVPLKTCDRTCPFSIAPDSRRHSRVCCTSKQLQKGQEVISDPVLQGLIPLGLFHTLWHNRCRYPDKPGCSLYRPTDLACVVGTTDADWPVGDRHMVKATCTNAELWHQRFNCSCVWPPPQDCCPPCRRHAC